jgi:hypothetical protein
MPTPKVNSWLGWRNFTVNRAIFYYPLEFFMYPNSLLIGQWVLWNQTPNRKRRSKLIMVELLTHILCVLVVFVGFPSSLIEARISAPSILLMGFTLILFVSGLILDKDLSPTSQILSTFNESTSDSTGDDMILNGMVLNKRL